MQELAERVKASVGHAVREGSSVQLLQAELAQALKAFFEALPRDLPRVLVRDIVLASALQGNPALLEQASRALELDAFAALGSAMMQPGSAHDRDEALADFMVAAQSVVESVEDRAALEEALRHEATQLVASVSEALGVEGHGGLQDAMGHLHGPWALKTAGRCGRSRGGRGGDSSW